MSILSLIQALDSGDMETVRQVLNSNPEDVSMRDGEDRVALHYAAECADIETFKQILELDLSLIDCVDQNGYTPLLIASMSGNIAAIEHLVEKGANVNHFDKDKHSAVHWAVVCGQLDAVATLIRLNANVNSIDDQGARPLHYATITEDVPIETSATILHHLIKNGAHVNSPDFDGRTPLLWAACNGNIEAIIALLQAGANMNAVDRNQLSVLHCAASQGHESVLHLLLQTSDPSLIDSVDRNGDTSLFYAATLGHYECARILLTAGANPNHQDNRLKCPSHCAAAKGQLRMLKLLKHYGASFEIQNRRGDIPLHEAIQTGSKDCVEWLLATQPSTIDATNHAGRSGLHLAAAAGNMELVVMLCTKNAEIDPLMLSDGKLYTPLDLAEMKNHEIVADYLKRRYNANRAEELSEKDREEWTAYLENQIERAQKLNARKTIIEVEYTQQSGTSKLIPRRHSFDNVIQKVQEISIERPITVPVATNTLDTSSRRVSDAIVAEQLLIAKSTSTTDLAQPNEENAEILAEEKKEKIEMLQQQDEIQIPKNESIAEYVEEEKVTKEEENLEDRNGAPIPKNQEELDVQEIQAQSKMRSSISATCEEPSEATSVTAESTKAVDDEGRQSRTSYDSNPNDANNFVLKKDTEIVDKVPKSKEMPISKPKSEASKRKKRRSRSGRNEKEKIASAAGTSRSETSKIDSAITSGRDSTASEKGANRPNVMDTLSPQPSKHKFFYDYSSAEASDENATNDSIEVTKKAPQAGPSTASLQKPPLPSTASLQKVTLPSTASSRKRMGIFNGHHAKSENLQQKTTGTSQLQAHETAIFQELTNLKKTQIQHGKEKEKTAVRALINKFCKKYQLDPSHFPFSSYNEWEKCLHEQLKNLYAEERQRLLRARTTKSSATGGRSGFRQTRATPISIQTSDLTELCNRIKLNPQTSYSQT